MVTEAQKETVGEEAPKPKLEDSPEFKEAVQKAIRAGTSKYQRQASEESKKAKAADARVQAIQDELAQAKEAAEIARLAGDDVDAADRVKSILQRERSAQKRLQEAEDRMATATEYEKRMTVQTLHVEFGIPMADLEDLETASEMKIAALEYKLAHPPTKAKVKEEEEEKESKPIDSAEGRLGSTKWGKPGSKEFEETLEKLKAGFSR